MTATVTSRKLVPRQSNQLNHRRGPPCFFVYSYGTVALRLVRLIFFQRAELRDLSAARPVFVKSPISLEALKRIVASHM